MVSLETGRVWSASSQNAHESEIYWLFLQLRQSIFNCQYFYLFLEIKPCPTYSAWEFLTRLEVFSPTSPWYVFYYKGNGSTNLEEWKHLS